MKTSLQKISELATISTRLHVDTEQQIARKNTERYQDTEHTNYTALFSETLARMAFNDSKISVSNADKKDPNGRVRMLSDAIIEFMSGITEYQAYVLGTGGAGLVFRLVDNIPCVDMFEQDRIVVNKKIMNQYKDVTIETDSITINKKKYTLKSRYYLKDGSHVIENEAFDEQGTKIKLESIEKWSDIKEQDVIKNVDRLLFFHWKCPKSTRRLNNVYGVPVTYGADEVLKNLQEHHERTMKEFKLSETMLGVDSRLFEKSNRTVSEGENKGLFVKMDNPTGDSVPWMIFNPNIRAEEQMIGKNYLYDVLERIVGTSGDILGKPTNSASTAYEVKANRYNTSTFISAIWGTAESMLGVMCYSFDVLLENAHIHTGMKDTYKLEFSWNYSLSEDPVTQYTQLLTLAKDDYAKPERVNAFVTGQTLDEAKEEIAELKAEGEKTREDDVKKAMDSLDEPL